MESCLPNCLSVGLDAQTIADVNAGFASLHYFFAGNRPFFYGVGDNSEIVISQSQNENFFFNGSPDNTSVSYTVNTGMFLCRVYEGVQTLNPLSPNDIDVKGPDGEVQITTDSTGKMIMDKITAGQINRVIFNGLPYRVASVAANYGLIARQFYDYKLTPTK